MKKQIILFLFISSQAFAICDTQKAERDEFRNLCLSLGGISTGVSYGGHALLPVVGGLFGIIPGLIAQNQCRIWAEKESNLKLCEEHYYAQQQAELRAQQAALAAAQARAARIVAINTTYNEREETARTQYRSAVRALMQRYIQEGRNIRDATVQAELRSDVRSLENTLNLDLQRLTSDRQREIGAA